MYRLTFLWFFLGFRKIISQMFLFSWRFFFGNYSFIFFTRIMIENFLMHKVSLFGVFKIVSIKFYAVLSWLRGHFQIDLATPTFYTTHAPHKPSTEKKKEIRCSEIVTLLTLLRIIWQLKGFALEEVIAQSRRVQLLKVFLPRPI